MNDRSYIIRIYRSSRRRATTRRASDAVAIAGIVETPASDQHQAFHDIEELWAILAHSSISDLNQKHSRKR